MRKIPTALAAISLTALVLTGCSDPDSAGSSTGTSDAPSSSSSASASSDASAFDVTSLSAVPEIASLVPQDIKDRGTLRNGASTDYAPAEFLTSDGQTPTGYEVDLVKALALVMGLEDGTTTTAEFPTIIPALGTKYDIGASSFTITAEREQQVNLVSYIQVGSSYAVASGNPKNFDPNNPCGATIGVQNGTSQADYAQELAQQCVADGKDTLTVMPLDLQTDVSTKVIGGQYDATLADSTVIGYTIQKASGQLEQVGDVIESAPQGIAVSKDDEQLTKAIQAALQHLMDQGDLTKILGSYGASDAALSTAEINPTIDN